MSSDEEMVGGINEIRRPQTELIHMARKVQLAQQGLRGYWGAATTGQEEERRRLARDLHDDTTQSLIALNQQIQLAQMSSADAASTDRLVTMQQMAEQNRIAQEGLSNVARHAQAKKAEVCLQFTDKEVRLAIRDDGLGFVSPGSPAEMSLAGHFGLLGTRKRAEAIGARLQIKSAVGAGTELVVYLAQSHVQATEGGP